MSLQLLDRLFGAGMSIGSSLSILPCPSSSSLDRPADVGLDICVHLLLQTSQSRMSRVLIFYRFWFWIVCLHLSVLQVLHLSVLHLLHLVVAEFEEVVVALVVLVVAISVLVVAPPAVVQRAEVALLGCSRELEVVSTVVLLLFSCLYQFLHLQLSCYH